MKVCEMSERIFWLTSLNGFIVCSAECDASEEEISCDCCKAVVKPSSMNQRDNHI